MQSVDQETNEEEEQQRLEEDYSKPFSPPDGIKDESPSDDQRLDTGIDAHEWYDEGRDGASGAKDLEQRN